MTVDTRTRKNGEPVPLGPDSLTWEDFGSRRFHLMLPQAFLVQVSHPIIDAGVGEHSVYKTDPWGRARRSTELLWPVVYARPEDAIRKGRELRELHRSIKGVDKHGRKYHALNPEAYGWVHMTGFDATLRMHELFGKAPDAETRAQMFEEWRRMGLMMGVSERYLPATQAEYWEKFYKVIDEDLEMGDVAADLLSESHYLEVPRPPGSRLPDVVWKGILKVLGPRVRRLTIATLPQRYRERFNIPWSESDERRFRRFCRMVRVVDAVTPRPLRYIPLARAAMRDYRRHPEAYRVEPEAFTTAGGGQLS